MKQTKIPFSDYQNMYDEFDKGTEKYYLDKRKVTTRYTVPKDEYRKFEDNNMNAGDLTAKISIDKLEENEVKKICKKALLEYVKKNVIHSNEFQEYLHKELSKYLADKIHIDNIEYNDNLFD